MNETKQRLKEAVLNYKAAISKMKEDAIAFIEAIPDNAAKRISASPSIFTVNFSSVKANGGILSTFYYDIVSQKRELVNIIKKSKGTEFLTTLEDIAKTGKQTVRCGNTSYHQVYAPTVVNALKTFIFEEE